MESKPYPGLRPFKEEESLVFFGQNKPLADLRERLYAQRFVAIVGLSGCGKSSLLHAGLLADIRHKKIDRTHARWLIGSMRPGSNPLRNLTEAVAGIAAKIAAQNPELVSPAERIPVDTQNDLVRDGFGLARFGHNALRHPQQQILIVVDQFEELFRYQREASADEAPIDEGHTYKEKDRSALFVRLLIEAVRDVKCRVSVVITMRSEFIGDCSLFFGLAELFSEGTFLLPRLSRGQIEQAIIGPAEKCGFTVDPSAVQEMLNETDRQEDGLPLLQHALRRIWERPRPNADALSLKDFHSFDNQAPAGIPNIKHHLDDHLDYIYRSVGEQRKDVTKLLFRLLSKRDPSGRLTRRPLAFSHIAAAIGKDRSEDIKFVIEVFRDETSGCTFLTPPKKEFPEDEPLEGVVVDVSHECLLRRWDRLGRWIELEENDGEQFLRLAGDTDEADLLAQRTNQPREPLSGPNLDRFSQWWNEAKLISPGWAIRYQGKYSKALKRPERSYESARNYLIWSQGKAEEALAQRETDKHREAVALAEIEATKLREAEALADLEVGKRKAAEALAEIEAVKLREAEALAGLEAGRRKAAESLAEVEASRRRTTRWRAVAVTLAAVCLAVVVFLWSLNKASQSRQLEKSLIAADQLSKAAQEKAQLALDDAKRLAATNQQLQQTENTVNVQNIQLEQSKAKIQATNVRLAEENEEIRLAESKLESAFAQLRASDAKVLAAQEATSKANAVEAARQSNEEKQKAQNLLQSIGSQDPEWERSKVLNNLDRLTALAKNTNLELGQSLTPILGKLFVLTLMRDNDPGNDQPGSPVILALGGQSGSGIRVIKVGNGIAKNNTTALAVSDPNTFDLPFHGGLGVIHNAAANPAHPGYVVKGGTGGWIFYEFESPQVPWKRHFFPITGLGYSTDGQWIASASASGDLRLANSAKVSAGQNLSFWQNLKNISGLAANTSKLIADLFAYRYKGDYPVREFAIELPSAQLKNGTVKRRDVKVYGITEAGQFVIWKHPGPLGTQIRSVGNKPGRQWVVPITLEAHGAAALATEPSTQQVWLGYSDGRIANLTEDRLCPNLTQPTGVFALAWDAASSRLAIGSSTGTVRVYERAPGKTECDVMLLLQIPAHGASISSLVWQKDLLITGSTDGSARSWNLALSKQQQAILKMVLPADALIGSANKSSEQIPVARLADQIRAQLGLKEHPGQPPSN